MGRALMAPPAPVYFWLSNGFEKKKKKGLQRSDKYIFSQTNKSSDAGIKSLYDKQTGAAALK